MSMVEQDAYGWVKSIILIPNNLVEYNSGGWFSRRLLIQKYIADSEEVGSFYDVENTLSF